MAMCQWTVATSSQILQLNWLETLAGYEYHCFVTYCDWYVFYNGIWSLRPGTFGRRLGHPIAATRSVLKGLIVSTVCVVFVYQARSVGLGC